MKPPIKGRNQPRSPGPDGPTATPDPDGYCRYWCCGCRSARGDILETTIAARGAVYLCLWCGPKGQGRRVRRWFLPREAFTTTDLGEK